MLESPVQLSICGDFHECDARRCAAIRSRNAPRIEKTDAANSFVARHMSVGVEEDVTVVRWARRRNMLEPKPEPIPNQINNQGPGGVGVAISPNDR